jgi:hypothetical protein
MFLLKLSLPQSVSVSPFLFYSFLSNLESKGFMESALLQLAALSVLY